MKKLTQFINEALGNIGPWRFAKVWKGEHLDLDNDHLENAAYVFTELMNVHRDKLPTTEEFTNMCRWFADTYKDQPYVTKEFVEELMYRFFDTFVKRTQKRTFTKEIKHTNYIDLGHDDLFKREISYEYLTKTIRAGVDIDIFGRKELDGYDYDYINQEYMESIPNRLLSILYMAAHIRRKRSKDKYFDLTIKVYEDALEDFLKRWKISFEDFINNHDYSKGMEIIRKMFNK